MNLKIISIAVAAVISGCSSSGIIDKKESEEVCIKIVSIVSFGAATKLLQKKIYQVKQDEEGIIICYKNAL